VRILYIIDNMKEGGKERQLAELVKSLKNKNGIDLLLVILSDATDYDYIDKLDADIRILKRKYKKDISIFGKISKICEDFRPDIIHSWELMCSVYSLPVAKMKGIKFVNGIVRSAPSESDINAAKWIWTRLTFLFSDVILGNSHAGLLSFKAPGAKSSCIYNGFDFGRLQSIQSAEKIKRNHNICTENVVGMVARFNAHKGYDLYIKSAMNILDRRNNVTFVAVGTGDTFDNCVNLVPAKYKGHIRFLGQQRDVESIVNAFDIGVLVSKNEGISNAIMEYMALEKPVVASMNSGNEELVQNNTTGLLAKHGDIADLTEKIEYLLSNKDVAAAMGKAGRERVERMFNIEKMALEHMNLYERVLNG